MVFKPESGIFANGRKTGLILGQFPENLG